MLDTVPQDALGPLLIAVGGIVSVLVQRGRRESSDRFDRLERQLQDVSAQLVVVDKRQDLADVERAVIRNEVDTIKDRHAVVDMLHRRGVHRGSRRGLWLALAISLGCVMRWG